MLNTYVCVCVCPCTFPSSKLFFYFLSALDGVVQVNQELGRTEMWTDTEALLGRAIEHVSLRCIILINLRQPSSFQVEGENVHIGIGSSIQRAGLQAGEVDLLSCQSLRKSQTWNLLINISPCTLGFIMHLGGSWTRETDCRLHLLGLQ